MHHFLCKRSLLHYLQLLLIMFIIKQKQILYAPVLICCDETQVVLIIRLLEIDLLGHLKEPTAMLV